MLRFIGDSFYLAAERILLVYAMHVNRLRILYFCKLVRLQTRLQKCNLNASVSCIANPSDSPFLSPAHFASRVSCGLLWSLLSNHRIGTIGIFEFSQTAVSDECTRRRLLLATRLKHTLLEKVAAANRLKNRENVSSTRRISGIFRVELRPEMERRLLETKTAIAQLPKDRGRPQNRVDYTCAAARPGR